MIELFLLFAQGKQAAPGGSLLVQFVPFILIFVLFWFLIIRPQRKRERQHQEMLGNLKTGERVVTSSGILGDVTEVTPQTITLEIARGVKVVFQRQAITGIVSDSSGRTPVSTSSSTPESEKEISNASKKKRRKKK